MHANSMFEKCPHLTLHPLALGIMAGILLPNMYVCSHPALHSEQGLNWGLLSPFLGLSAILQS